MATTGEPYAVLLTPNKTTLSASGGDVGVINVSVTDKQGREVPDAANELTFSLSDGASIMGVGNGDPSSHEPDKVADKEGQRKLFSGKCQAIIQPGNEPGTVTFTAAGTGLKPASVALTIR